MSNQEPTLPALRHQEPPQPPFPVGSLVLLKSAPFGVPGVVQRVERRYVHVKWLTPNHLARHEAHMLMLADSPIDLGMPATGQQAGQDAPLGTR